MKIKITWDKNPITLNLTSGDGRFQIKRRSGSRLWNLLDGGVVLGQSSKPTELKKDVDQIVNKEQNS